MVIKGCCVRGLSDIVKKYKEEAVDNKNNEKQTRRMRREEDGGAWELSPFSKTYFAQYSVLSATKREEKCEDEKKPYI